MRVLIGGTPTGTLKHISATAYREHCGMLTSWRDRSDPQHAVRLGAPWALDNFAYTAFEAEAFRASLERLAGVPGCLFVVAPDVWGDAAATVGLFAEWREAIKGHGFPVALAVQDGLEKLPIDWSALDAVFVGGSNGFRRGEFVRELIGEARSRRKWVHVGRVNSARRWQHCLTLGADSVDGTGLVIERRRVLEALRVIENPQPPLVGLWDKGA